MLLFLAVSCCFGRLLVIPIIILLIRDLNVIQGQVLADSITDDINNDDDDDDMNTDELLLIEGSSGVSGPVEHLRVAGLRSRADGRRLRRCRVLPEGAGVEARRHFLDDHAQLGAGCVPPRSAAFPW